VHLRPFRSGPVAVLSCCARWQGPQQFSDVAVLQPRPGFLPPPRVAGFHRWPTCQVACRTSKLSADTPANQRLAGTISPGSTSPWVAGA
jgi:hypothetical protein